MNHIYGKKRKKEIGKYIVIVIFLIIIGVIFSLSWFGIQLIFVKGNYVSDFEILEGQMVNNISSNLFKTGAIKSKLVFQSYLYLRNLETSIKAGVYQIPPANIINLTKILLAGPIPAEARITLIEGWTLADFASELAENGLVNIDEFMDIVAHPIANGITQETFPILYSKPNNVDLEGYLFPDTYRVFETSSTTEIIAILINNLTNKITETMARDIDAQGKTFHEILTMASIIEKEVHIDRDRRIVSGILWNRIDAGIPLQVDSTINYITRESKPAVSLKETQINNPFNTYLYPGLPPGPIANPGMSAIMAAIYPTETNNWFYLSTPEGKTIFSETLDQHNEAKAKYLK